MSTGEPSVLMNGQQGSGDRAVPYFCPFCGEEDLRPVPDRHWHCRSCLRLFSLAFHGLRHHASDETTSGSPR